MGDKKRIPIDANLDNEWEKDMMQLPKEAPQILIMNGKKT